MYKLNAFIVDKQFLEQLEANKDVDNLSDQMNFRNIKQFSSNESENLHLTFALSSEKLPIIQSVSSIVPFYNFLKKCVNYFSSNSTEKFSK